MTRNGWRAAAIILGLLLALLLVRGMNDDCTLWLTDSCVKTGRG